MFGINCSLYFPKIFCIKIDTTKFEVLCQVIRESVYDKFQNTGYKKEMSSTAQRHEYKFQRQVDCGLSDQAQSPRNRAYYLFHFRAYLSFSCIYLEAVSENKPSTGL